ncbi:MAG: hypothetical protein ACRCSK_05040 [Fusobacteriaceae bacterium]
MLKKIKLKKLLDEASILLSEIQNEIKYDLQKFSFEKNIVYEFENESRDEMYKKNFFTLLMLTLFISAKIKNNKIKSYGKIIFALRQIVTCTDNIIDGESKGVVHFKNFKNIVVKNNFMALICQDILTKECLKISDGDEILSNKIFEELYTIAFSEDIRDRNLYKNYPSSEFILENIHGGIGGKLLEISLVAAKYLEKNFQIEKFAKGLYEIGMSLQALDDLFDVSEDFESEKINLAHATFLEKNINLNMNSKLNPNLDLEKEKDFTTNFLKNVMAQSYSGFKILEENNFPISDGEVKILLKKLFELRGLGDYAYVID